ncbi:MAG: hypothetical protein J7501_12660 [Bdellovibrio sp.]|nr:hypothetical protein [Bdellovibrio sp.]
MLARLYSTTQSTLTITDARENKSEVIKNVSFQIKAVGVFELVNKDGKVLQTLTLNNNGSDGMSENIYPYEAKDNSLNIIGGCSSNYQKVIVR